MTYAISFPESAQLLETFSLNFRRVREPALLGDFKIQRRDGNENVA